MPIDYHRLVDGMSEATRMVQAGAAGLSVIDLLLTSLREATGASGATFIEFGPEDGRVIVGNGAMTWSTGQPVVNEALEREELGMWWHDTRVLPGRIGELLPRRGMTGCVGHAGAHSQDGHRSAQSIRGHHRVVARRNLREPLLARFLTHRR